MPPIAVMQIKEIVNAGLNAPLDTALMLERKAFQLQFATRDQKEGMRAFLEKRKPNSKGSERADLSRDDLTVAVFGAGTMGRGIAQVCAQAGLTTLLFDSRDGAVTRGDRAHRQGARRLGDAKAA